MTSIRKTGLSAEPGHDDKADSYSAALEKSRRLCASREYCISDIRSRIEEWGLVPPEKAEKIIASLIADRFIDEQRYAMAFARDRLRYNRWGRIKISYALKMKGLPSGVITQALNGIDNGEYRAVAAKLVAGLLKGSKKNDRRLKVAAVVRSMQSRGFEMSVTMELLKEAGQNSDLTITA